MSCGNFFIVMNGWMMGYLSFGTAPLYFLLPEWAGPEFKTRNFLPCGGAGHILRSAAPLGPMRVILKKYMDLRGRHLWTGCRSAVPRRFQRSLIFHKK